MEINILAERVDNLIKSLTDHMDREEKSDERIASTLDTIQITTAQKVSWTVLLTICGGFLTVLAGMFWTYHAHDLDDAQSKAALSNNMQNVNGKMDVIIGALKIKYPTL
jgi:hypothetical protein